MYHYFVSFTHEHNNFGNSCVTTVKPITTAEDIIMLTKKITEHLGVENVIILNYQLLRKEPDAE